MRIIPAIDIISGKCVRLTRGDYATQKIYNENPVEVALEFEANGVEFLHLVDLDGAKSNSIVNHRVLHDIASKTSLKIDFGGGLKSNEDVKIAFENGALQITAGSIAFKNRPLFLEWLSIYGSEKIILGADAHYRKIATQGWLQTSDTDVVEFIDKYAAVGLEYVICTDIAKDGMLEGSSHELYAEILKKTPVKLIASGGVSSIEDLLALKQIGCEGAILGKAIYENKITLSELRQLI